MNQAGAAGLGKFSTGDADLLERIKARDDQAMTAFFDRHSSMVYSVALRVLHDPSQAEDVMQEIFLQIWLNPGSFVKDRGSLAGWLTVVSRNRAIDSLRRRKPCDPVDEVALASKFDLASEAERNTLIARVRAILSNLPEEQRSSMEMAFFEGMSHSEISEKTGHPLGTVKTRIRLALIELRKALA
jgi:RNA polymerase sigma-70 factor (ECF subfamily)